MPEMEIALRTSWRARAVLDRCAQCSLRMGDLERCEYGAGKSPSEKNAWQV